MQQETKNGIILINEQKIINAYTTHIHCYRWNVRPLIIFEFPHKRPVRKFFYAKREVNVDYVALSLKITRSSDIYFSKHTRNSQQM